MSKVCEITGKKVITGNNVSHSNARTKRKFYPNIHKKKFYNEEEDKFVTLIVSAKGIKIINKKGVDKAIKDATEKGYYKK